MVKSSSPSRKISAAIQERGPLTVAAFMELALYDAEIGYYARAPRRSGRAGDFFTSVDVGPLFGELLATQVAEMVVILNSEFGIQLDDRGPAAARQVTTVQMTTREGPPSTPALEHYLERLGVTLEPGCRAEINLQAVDWIRDAARRLRRGFIIVIDYGHEARELYSPTHAQGTLTTFARHMLAGPESAGAPPWLQQPGEQDITAHVDFTSVRAAAEAEGLRTLGFLDQTYFLLGILTGGGREPVPLEGSRPPSRHLNTLLMPGGLGSTHKVLILGKGVGTPALLGCSYRQRIT